MPVIWNTSKEPENGRECHVELSQVQGVRLHESGTGSRLLLVGGSEMAVSESPGDMMALILQLYPKR